MWSAAATAPGSLTRLHRDTVVHAPWYGAPIRWVTVIDAWEPGVRFVDRQVVGPYRWWRHEHRFARAGDATRVVDDVEYVPRAAWLTRRIVGRDVERIFDFRQAALARLFAQTSARIQA